MSIKNGDLPAMPIGYIDYQYRDTSHHGLSKRERMAMSMAQGILSNSSNSMNHVARDAVLLADELLAELEK